MVFLFLLAALAVAVYLFLQHHEFGSLPTGRRIARVQQSPHYKNGAFQNLSHTPDFTEGVGYREVGRAFFFGKSDRNQPKTPLPSEKADFQSPGPNQNVLVWFGRSSYFVQLDGKTILATKITLPLRLFGPSAAPRAGKPRAGWAFCAFCFAKSAKKLPFKS